MNIIFPGAGVITGLFYIGIILFGKKHINKYFLLAFIVALCVPLLPVLLNEFQLRPPSWLNVSISLFWGPILYFYIISLLREKINSSLVILHLLPYVVFYILATLFFSDILPAPPQSNMPPGLKSNSTNQLIFPIIQNCTLFGYSLITLTTLNKHYRTIKNHYSYIDVYLTIRWSYVIVVFFVTAYLLIAIIQIFLPKFSLSIFLDLQNILISLFIYFLGYLGIHQKPVYLDLNSRISQPSVDNTSAKTKEKYSKNKLSETLKNEYKQKLLDYMESEKPYLQPKLSIDDLSEAILVPKHFISQIINDSFNHNFYSFINSYRVSEVKERIAKDKEGKYTLLSIALDSGFNSKSGFNTNFKLKTGMTPFEFRKSLN